MPPQNDTLRLYCWRNCPLCHYCSSHSSCPIANVFSLPIAYVALFRLCTLVSRKEACRSGRASSFMSSHQVCDIFRKGSYYTVVVSNQDYRPGRGGGVCSFSNFDMVPNCFLNNSVYSHGEKLHSALKFLFAINWHECRDLQWHEVQRINDNSE